MEYVEGVPVDKIRREASEFGLLYDTQQRVLREWAAEMRRLAPLTAEGIAPDEANVVYSFATEKFRVIDPH